VNRFVKYWDKRVEAFGPIYAFQPLTLNGALRDDTIPLEIGAIQIIRRRNDRDILYFDPSKLDKTKYTRESARRAFWYLFHALLEDVNVQKRGLIVINYNANFSLSNRDPPFTKMFFNTIKGALPIRISAIHGCHVPYIYGCVIALLMIFLGERLRKRIVVHNGTNDEVNAALVKKFGIAMEYIPSDMGGLLKLDIYNWLQERRNAGL
jgi:CRAL/TRIO domain